MKIEKLTDNKIRIIIDLDELSEKNIDVNSLIKNNDKAHVLFQTILNEAEKQVGFKVQNCKLLVEAFSTTDGYVVFTLTKYKNEAISGNSSKKVRYRRKTLSTSYKNAIYKFNNFDEIDKYVELGLDGVEVWSPLADEETVEKLTAICKSKKLLMTGGSDFHGIYGDKTVTLGACSTPQEHLDKLLGYKAKKKRAQRKAEKAAAEAAENE